MAEYSPDSEQRFKLGYYLPPQYPWADQVHYYDCLGSTSDLAKALAQQGAPHGTLVLAEAQTGGRGRMGRSFHSAPGLGLYFSLILRPNCRPTELMHLTCAVAVAVQDALQRHLAARQTAHPVEIKWINDLVIRNRKVGGILTELSLDSKTGLVRYAVIGIGINCYHQPKDFPEELRDKAASLFTFCPKVHHWDLLSQILHNLTALDQILLTEKAAIMARYRQHCLTLGKEVSIHGTVEVRHGIAEDMDEDGGLIVRFPDGHRETVSAGEVSVRGMYGYV